MFLLLIVFLCTHTLVGQKTSVLGVLDPAAEFVLLTFFCFAVAFCVGDDKQIGRKRTGKQFVLLQVGCTLFDDIFWCYNHFPSLSNVSFCFDSISFVLCGLLVCTLCAVCVFV